MSDFFSCLIPYLHRFEPERAHALSMAALRLKLYPRSRLADDPALAQTLFGLKFRNPVGLAAGFDKNAEVFDAFLGLGFGFVEVGTLTPRPQPGNPKPRLFRLAADQAVINRLGFNNKGLAAAAGRLRRAHGHLTGPVGLNLGANKASSDKISDYAAGVSEACGLADYISINISSPNTPGLRGLQSAEMLDKLVTAVLAARDRTHKLPVLLKIAPDLELDALQDIADIVMAQKIDGVIISNTTTARPELKSDPHTNEEGGLSGRPLFVLSTRVLARFYRLTGGAVPLIGVGGIDSAASAYTKIRAGASLVQLYSALIYQGPALVEKIVRQLPVLLRHDGFDTLTQAIGIDAEIYAEEN